jgi:general secretion pathway protein H
MSKGFSLIELLVVMTLVALMMSLHPAVGSALFSSLTVESGARQLLSDLNAVRSQALFENRETVVVFDVPQSRYRAAGKVVSLAELPDISLSLTTAAHERYAASTGGIRFYPDGSSTGGRVTLDNGRVVYDITVDWFDGHTSIAQQTNDAP